MALPQENGFFILTARDRLIVLFVMFLTHDIIVNLKGFSYVTMLCRRELYHVQRELLRERTRCKALEEELENPMNIHRWRKLEVRDRTDTVELA